MSTTGARSAAGRTGADRELARARTAVAIVFVANGLVFATLFSRVPDLRRALGLGNGELGLLLLAAAAGSVLSLPTSGALIERWGAAAVVRRGALLSAAGLLAVAGAIEVAPLVALAALGLAAYGVGVGMWDVAMNAEGARVEQGLGTTIMPRFHAGFSLGSVAGAGLGAVSLLAGVPALAQLGVLAIAAWVTTRRASRTFLPSGRAAVDQQDEPPVKIAAWRAWTEPRTLVVGLMVLCFAIAEGSANDWLSLALIDGYDARPALGVAGFATFVSAMTLGRFVGPVLLDRHGRVPVLAGSAAFVAAGTLLVVLGSFWPLVVLGIVCWGLGASLGFPVGMSAAADDPARAAARLSVVSTVGYGAFLAGPPLLGHLGDAVGTLPALLAVTALMAPAVLTLRSLRTGVTG